PLGREAEPQKFAASALVAPRRYLHLGGRPGLDTRRPARLVEPRRHAQPDGCGRPGLAAGLARPETGRAPATRGSAAATRAEARAHRAAAGRGPARRGPGVDPEPARPAQGAPRVDPQRDPAFAGRGGGSAGRVAT